MSVSFVFGKRSLERLSECHPDLQRIAHELIKEMDVTVLCGHRSKEEQDKAFNSGYSKLRWPLSKHNQTPALAMDLAPYPVDFSARARFLEMRERIRAIAKRLDISVRFISWDLPHVELAQSVTHSKN
jgi:peptidoglycan LD-endopeptidase CwlK